MHTTQASPSPSHKCSGSHYPGLQDYSTCAPQVHSELGPQTWLAQIAELGPGRAMNLEYLWDRTELAYCLTYSVVLDTSIKVPVPGGGEYVSQSSPTA